jgi:hypothetical protein
LIAEEAIKRKLVPKVGRETIRILLQSHELKPWRGKNVVHSRVGSRRTSRRWKTCWPSTRSPIIPPNPLFCLDEKPISLHADVRPPTPAKPGKVAKQDNEYQRCGTANVFGVVEPKGGRHFTTATPNRSGAEFARMVEHVVEQYPAADTIHLVMDNLNIHCRKSLTDCFGEQKGGDIRERLSVHYTPKHGSWLDQAEIELSMFSRQCLGTRRIPDLATLKRETRAWSRKANQKRTKINWRFTRQKARKVFKYEAPGRRG